MAREQGLCTADASGVSSSNDSSCNYTPTDSRSAYLREIHHIDHNEELQRVLAYSTALLHTAERIATGDKRDLAPQQVHPA